MKRKYFQAAVALFFLGVILGGSVLQGLRELLIAATPLLVMLAILGLIGRKVLGRYRRF